MHNRKVLGSLDEILSKEVKPLISSNIRDLNREKSHLRLLELMVKEFLYLLRLSKSLNLML